MRTGDNSYASQERTLKDLSPNVAALLCYVGGWISGIVFLVLEQKNRFVRFHALQSIIVFGALTLASAVLGHLPVMGTFFSVVIGISGFILWIILMVKAVNGELFKMPWAGNLAERLANESIPPAPPSSPRTEDTAGIQPARIEPSRSDRSDKAQYRERNRSERVDNFLDRYYSTAQRTGRLVASAFGIAWSVALLIFFNFYNQYIAWYEPVHSAGSTTWQRHTLVTSDFNLWLPVVTAALVVSIIGHAVSITFDRYLLRQLVRTVTDVFGAVSVFTLLAIFPFNFNILPTAAAADGATIGVTIALIFFAVCFSISAIVNFVQLIVHGVRGEY